MWCFIRARTSIRRFISAIASRSFSAVSGIGVSAAVVDGHPGGISVRVMCRNPEHKNNSKNRTIRAPFERYALEKLAFGGRFLTNIRGSMSKIRGTAPRPGITRAARTTVWRSPARSWRPPILMLDRGDLGAPFAHRARDPGVVGADLARPHEPGDRPSPLDHRRRRRDPRARRRLHRRARHSRGVARAPRRLRGDVGPPAPGRRGR